MACCDQVSARVFCELATGLPNLTTLDVRGTQFSDQGCAILAHYCYKLRELNLSCCPVGDSGMFSLCASIPGARKKCPNLRKLDIRTTMVGLKGTKEVLRSLPDLQWLAHPLVYMALGFLHYDDFIEGQTVPFENQYKLRNSLLEYYHLNPALLQSELHHGVVLDEELIERFIFTTFAYCPLITHVDINIRMTPKIWKAMSTLKHLQHIEIADEASGDFDTRVFPILHVNGENVRHLQLSHINNIDLDVIGVTCPKLKKLMITQSGFTDYGFVQNSHPELIRAHDRNCFRELTDLHLTFTDQFFHGDFNINRLLSQCIKLKNLILINIQSFTDEVFENVLSVNPLVELETLSLFSCSAIGGENVSRLLYMNNDLWSLTLKGCDNITRRETDEMKKYVKQRKLDVNILWD